MRNKNWVRCNFFFFNHVASDSLFATCAFKSRERNWKSEVFLSTKDWSHWTFTCFT